MNYYLLTISYDGSELHGWAKQNNLLTAQGELEKSFVAIFKSNLFHTLGASKTDAGVHARNQKVFLQTEFRFNHRLIARDINSRINKNIFVKSIVEISPDFLVRNCKQKTYRYYLSTNEYDPLKRRYYHFLKFEFNKFKFEESLKLFVGLHDFRNFSGLKKNEYDNYNLERKIDHINIISEDDNNHYIEFKAKGFLRYQIRKIIGTCIAYNNNTITLEDIKKSLSINGEKMKFIADPSGLLLYDIIY
ncbi:tRNA pseudouridine(38-40) synthase TruA [Spiroplasma endosymbiont of Aspidapion aeneum]|uniref:tRNA pseudouridine(38-40) synthase TruA n=1 Tax=Spiroplasma endosymbiont of Aspidapion aeneum TaxID=3066276 RepID=UPI00313B9D75